MNSVNNKFKLYRVDFINGVTAIKNHKDYITLKGALRFCNFIGYDNCILKQYNIYTFEYIPIEFESFSGICQ